MTRAMEGGNGIEANGNLPFQEGNAANTNRPVEKEKEGEYV